MYNRNPVARSVKPVVNKSVMLSIDASGLSELARRYASEELVIPAWKEQVFPKSTDIDTVAFMIVGNSINFAFTDFATGTKYETEYDGATFRGAFGMWAALKRGMDSGLPILDGRFLEQLSEEGVNEIFEGNTRMTMLHTRLDILRHMGRVLGEKYDSNFGNLIDRSNGRLFDHGSGFVERLVNDFNLAFDDRATYGSMDVIFNKKAQLAAAMIQGRFLSEGIELFQEGDVDMLTVFADYELPRILQASGVLVYSEELLNMIEHGMKIAQGSVAEVEIRANTVHAGEELRREINALRRDNVNALQIDYRIWSEGRKLSGTRHHITQTSAY